MAFTENLEAFLDVSNGFALDATLNGTSLSVIFDAPGAEVLDGSVATTEPSILVKASDGAATGQTLVIGAEGLPAQLAQIAGTYKLRAVLAEPPDGVFVRAMLART